MSKIKHIHIRWINPDNQRCYEVYLAPNLLGWCLTQAWGKRNTALGRIVHRPFDSFESGEKVVNKIIKIRSKHGYMKIDG